jgi:S-DNA-T family DNA segregation ATPase FtsK/SpoIIIE
MARKRRKSNKKSSAKAFDIDLAVIILIVMGILACIVIYGDSGVAGETLSPALGGCFGGLKYLIPIGIFGAAYVVGRDDGKYIKSKLFQTLLLLGFIAAVLTIYQISNGNISTEKGFESVVQAGYEFGIKNKGGGTVGAVIAYPLVMLFGDFGAAVVCLGAAMFLLVFTFGLRPSQMIEDLIDRIEESKELRRQEDEERQAKREARRKTRVANISIDEDKNVLDMKKRKSSREQVTSITPEADEMVENMQMHLEDTDKNQKNSRIKGLLRKSDKTAKIVEADSLDEIHENNPEEITDLFREQAVIKENKTQTILQLDHSTTEEDDDNYEFPPIDLMKPTNSKSSKNGGRKVAETAQKLQKTLYSFGVSAKVENYSIGPAITRYELKPAEGVRVSKIAKLSDDIALNLAAETIRIEAPIPGKQAVGIEIPNPEREIVPLRDVLESDEFKEAKSKVSMGLGKDISGAPVIADIGKMPHVLIAGSTGSGKSVCVNSLITSVLYKAKPSEVKLLMIDPKVVELSIYNGIPHLLIPVVTDPKKAAGALAWAVQEMENRYQLFAKKCVRDLKGYNAAVDGVEHRPLPQIIIIVDELADLMMVASKEVEDAICRLAQKARAAGMHLVIATQRPSVDVITGLIKANVPSRIAFAVSSQIDSRTILDMSGAEKLLGKGDMLFYPIGANKPQRVQGAFVSDEEVENIVGFIKSHGVVTYSEDIIEQIENSGKSDKEKDEEMDEEDDCDPFLNEAIECVIDVGQASTSFIQRKFKVGYARAGRIIDQMEKRGIISGYAGSKPREVLMSKERWQELNMSPNSIPEKMENVKNKIGKLQEINRVSEGADEEDEF